MNFVFDIPTHTQNHTPWVPHPKSPSSNTYLDGKFKAVIVVMGHHLRLTKGVVSWSSGSQALGFIRMTRRACHFDSAGLGWGLKIWVSNKAPGDADAARPGT